jgi:hypothetical protein
VRTCGIQRTLVHPHICGSLKRLTKVVRPQPSPRSKAVSTTVISYTSMHSSGLAGSHLVNATCALGGFLKGSVKGVMGKGVEGKPSTEEPSPAQLSGRAHGELSAAGMAGPVAVVVKGVPGAGAALPRLDGPLHRHGGANIFS